MLTTPTESAANPLPAKAWPGDAPVPAMLERTGAAGRFVWEEFFSGQLRNRHTRAAYLQAVMRFLAWVEPMEDVQFLLGHSDVRVTRLYDRRQRRVTRNIVERISV